MLKPIKHANAFCHHASEIKHGRSFNLPRILYQSEFVMIMVQDSLLFPFSFIRFEMNVERKVVY